MGERFLKCSQESIRVESLGDPFDVAPLETREAALIATLKIQVREKIRFLYACRGERAWSYF